jgi:hypothetical protein
MDPLLLSDKLTKAFQRVVDTPDAVAGAIVRMLTAEGKTLHDVRLIVDDTLIDLVRRQAAELETLRQYAPRTWADFEQLAASKISMKGAKGTWIGNLAKRIKFDPNMLKQCKDTGYVPRSVVQMVMQLPDLDTTGVDLTKEIEDFLIQCDNNGISQYTLAKVLSAIAGKDITEGQIQRAYQKAPKGEILPADSDVSLKSAELKRIGESLFGMSNKRKLYRFMDTWGVHNGVEYVRGGADKVLKLSQTKKLREAYYRELKLRAANPKYAALSLQYALVPRCKKGSKDRGNMSSEAFVALAKGWFGDDFVPYIAAFIGFDERSIRDIVSGSRPVTVELEQWLQQVVSNPAPVNDDGGADEEEREAV